MKKLLLFVLISIFGGYSFSQVPNPPSLIYPLDSTQICTTTPTFVWSPVTGATSYRIQVSKHPNFDTLVLDVGGLTNSGYQTPTGNLNYNNTYYWRVNATGTGGTSNWSIV